MSFLTFSVSASQIKSVSIIGFLCPAPVVVVEQAPACYDVWDFCNFYEVWDDFYVIADATELETVEAVEAQLLLPAVAADAETRRVNARQAKYAAAIKLAAKARKVTVTTTAVVDDSAILVAEAEAKLAEQQRQSRIYWAKVRRDGNRAGFTLAAVVSMIAALRTGTTRKTVGGKGFTCQNTIATQQGDSSMSTNNNQARYSRRVNQSLARNKRANRQRRNGRRYISPITSQQRKANRAALAARQERRAKRRLLAKVIASERMVTLGLVTRFTKAMCATMVPKPVHFSKKVFTKTYCERPVLFGQPARKMTAVDFRRRYAEDGAYHRKADVRAAMRALNPDYDPDLRRANRVEVAPEPFSQESAIVAAEAQAALVMANTASKYAGAVGMTMMLSDDFMTAEKQPDSDSVQHNKANKAEIKSAGGAMYQHLIDVAVKAGGSLAGSVTLNGGVITGKVMAALCPINASDKQIISNLSPMLKANCCFDSDHKYFFDPEPTPGMSRGRGLLYAADFDKGAVAKEFGAVVGQPFRGLVAKLMTDPHYQVGLPLFMSHYYTKETLRAVDAQGNIRGIGSSDVHMVLNLPGRQEMGSVAGVPEADITGNRIHVRDMLFTGNADANLAVDLYKEENPGFSVNVAKSINECVADGESFYFNNEPTGIHIALVVAEIATVDGRDDIEFWKTGGEKASGQSRVYVNNMTIVYIPVAAAFKLFDPVPATDMYNVCGTGMWPLFPQVEGVVGVDCKPLNKRNNKMPHKNNPWSIYEQYCLPPLGDLTMAKTVVTPPAVTTTTEVKKPAARKEDTKEFNALLASGSYKEELAHYYATKKAAAFAGKAINEFDAMQFVKTKDYTPVISVIQKGLNPANFTNHYSRAAIATAAVAAKMSRSNPNQVICKGTKWNINHLRTLIDILVYTSMGGKVKVDCQVDGPTTSIKGYFEFKTLVGKNGKPNGEYELWMDGQPTFRFLRDNVVVDINRSRIFHHTMEFGYKQQKDVFYYVADSFSNFMHYFINGLLPLMGAYHDQALPANFRANCLSFLDGMPSIKLSKDNWQQDNGAACHMMRNSIMPIISSQVELLENGKWPALGSGAADLKKRHRTFKKLNRVKKGEGTVTKSINDLYTENLLGIMSQYYLESHFTKMCLLPFGGINVDLLKKCCPNLIKRGEQVLGRSFSSGAVAYVIIMTLKATKGLKRITLFMAQAADPVDPFEAGFLLWDQKVRTVGTAVDVLLAPSLIAPPGQNYITNWAKKIAARVQKTNRNYKVNSFKLGAEGHPFDFSVSTIQSIYSNTWTTKDSGDGYTYVYPNAPAFIEGNKPLLFSVMTDDANSIEVNDVCHERDYEGELLWVRYKTAQSVTRTDDNLVVEYCCEWVEHFGKLRSINKCQVVYVDPAFVRNELNPSLEGIDFDMVCTQDALKLDTLYSMLMLIANTVNANCKRGNFTKKILAMRELIAEINMIIRGYTTLEHDPMLIIEEISVAFGLYQKLLNYFEEEFVHPVGIWFDWINAVDQASIVYELYSAKVVANKGWEAVSNPIAEFPELAKVNLGGGKLIVYRESGEVTHKTNILAFVMVNGLPTGYMQRTYVICGDQETPVVNVELYESSTVQEAVSISKIRMPEIVGISHCITDPLLALEIQKEMLRGGRQAMLQVKALAYADAGATVHNALRNVKLFQAGNELNMSQADFDFLWEKLAKHNITLADLEVAGSAKFKQVSNAFRHVTFSMPKSVVTAGDMEDIEYEAVDLSSFGPDYEATVDTASTSAEFTLWMPALYSFTKLSSRNENNQDFVAKFYKEILKPMLRKQPSLALNSKMCYSVMKSLLNSENFICLPSGKQNATGKRVALGDARVGEIHLTESKRPNSEYQKALRTSINVKAALHNDIYVHGARAPIALGYIGKVIIRCERVVKDNEGNIVERYQVICRPGEPEVRATYYLSDVQIGTDVFLPTAYDRGDFDGDGFYITAITSQGVADNCWQDGVDVLNGSCELTLFDANNGSYFGDHYGIKSYAKAMKTMGSGIVNAITDKKGAIVDIKQHADNNKRAILVQHGAVGVAYAVYMIGMIMVDISMYLGKHNYANLDQLMKVLSSMDAKKLVGLVCEAYEVMLGGYDKAPDMYREKILDRIMTGERFVTVTKEVKTPLDEKHNADVAKNLAAVEEVMKALGLKMGFSKEVAAIIELTSVYYAVNKKYYFSGYKTVADCYKVENWVAIATFIFELGRGNFIGFKGVGRPNEAFNADESIAGKALAHQNCTAAAFAVVELFNSKREGEDTFKYEGNVYLYALKDLKDTLGNVMTLNQDEIKEVKWSDDDLLFFVNACKEVEATKDDDEDSDGDEGVTSSDINPDDFGGGGTEAKVETAKAVEQTSADSTTESAEPAGAVTEETEADAYQNNNTYEEEEADCSWGNNPYEDLNDEEYAPIPEVDNEGGDLINQVEAAPAVINFTETISLLNQLEEIYGSSMSVKDVKQRLINLNVDQQNKVNKLDEVSVVNVSEIVKEVEMKLETTAKRYYTGVGSRKTPADVVEVMKGMAAKLEQAGYTLRSGHADGADKAFEAGTNLFDSYLPWNTFNGGNSSDNGSQRYVVASQLNTYTQAQQILKETLDPSHFSHLSDAARKLHTRNVYQVLGDDLNTPSEVLYCWTLNGAEVGGTATAIKLAKRYGIKVVNLGDATTLERVKAKLTEAPAAEVEIVNEAPSRGGDVKSEANNTTEPEPALNWDMQNSVVFSTQTATHKTLSNLLGAPCIYKGVTYQSAEGAYQAAKGLNTSPETAARFAAYDGFTAKKQGYSVELRSDWDAVKNDIMKKVLVGKFSYEPAKTELLSTGDKTLVHSSPWEAKNGKTAYWGVDNNGVGYNWMGVLLMEVREEIKLGKDMTQTQEAPPRGSEVKQEVKKAPTISPHKLEKVKEIMSSLNDEQREVVKTVGNDKRNVFLTGKGGAGKSFTVEIIRKCYDVLGYPYIVIGSTGTSVVNINGHNTFNGMFGLLTGFKPKKDANGKVLYNDINRSLNDWTEIRNAARTSKQFNSRKAKLREAAEKHQRPILIILDEVSMIDSLLLSAVEEALTLLMVDHHWLLVGDPMQFEPVNGWQFFADVAVTKEDGSKEVKQSIYNQKHLAFTGFNLMNNMRAANDKAWADALDTIRMHHLQEELPDIVKQRWEYSTKHGAPKDALVLAPTNKTVKKFNDAATRKLIKAGAQAKEYAGKVQTKVMKAGAAPDYWLWTGSSEERVTIFAPISDKAIFCKGMRVMLRQTNIKDMSGNMEVNNGQTGTVLFLGDKFVKVKFDNGITKDISAIEMEDPQERGVFTQIPLVPAYALTITKCVAGYELVSTQRGMIPLKDVEIGDLVDTGKNSKPVIGKMYSGKKQVMRVTTRTGRSLDVSVDHPLLISKGQKPDWVTAGNVEVGDYACISRNSINHSNCTLPEPAYGSRSKKLNLPNVMTKDLAWVLGVLTGNGSVTDTKDGLIDVTNNILDDKVSEKYVAVLNSYDLHVGSKSTESKIRLWLNSMPFRNWLFELGLGYNKAADKVIPHSVLSSSKEVQAAFLAGLIDTDGHVSKNSIIYSTMSQTLAKQTQLLLQNLGIISRVHYQKGTDSYQVWISSKAILKLFKVYIPLQSTRKSEQLSTIISSIVKNKSELDYIPFKEEMVNEVKGRSGKAVIYSKSKLFYHHIQHCEGTMTDYVKETNYFYDQIASIETLDVVDMYDIEVEDEHCFAANGFVVHNCQGMTFDIPVVFHMYTETKTGKVMPVMMENAFYVALSRLTTANNCYFETNVSGVNRYGHKLTPYQLLLNSFLTNREALEFTYDLK